ncbi:putative bifunctional diguanylate cyclase/phosphodiesterase [Terricaulis sp.]|uniref:putative bifunctional diguanylate cyclase/phosphodiesterase n=1 Tax=Terricaulis sp. TaxID=2768686 RepID=UPI003783C296
MLALGRMLRWRRPQGLAGRAVVFATLLVAVTAVLSAAIVLFGAHREGKRLELKIEQDLTEYLATRSGDVLARGNPRILQYMITGSTRRSDSRAVLIVDAEGRLLAVEGGTLADRRAMAQLSAEAVATRRTVHRQMQDGALAVAAPIARDGQVIGVAARMWESGAYRFDVLSSLAPFLLILGCLVVAAIPLTGLFVRRAMAPLDQLSAFAERASEGKAAPLEIKTGDEFETLAKTFNHMMARIETSMRRIQEIAFVDPVTQLPNQDRFLREVDYHILQTKEGEAGALLVLEFQRMPKVLQTLDPDASREFMRVAAERFASAARTIDRAMGRPKQGGAAIVCARLGGVEFALFAPGLASSADAVRFAQHLNAALNQPFEWRGHKLMVGACCGVASAPRDGATAEAVIRRARMALTAAHVTPSKLKVFTQSLDREAVARITLEREMRGALDRNEFRAYFQPKINLATRRIEACEALARWVRPDRTIVSPGRFIPVAEESGLIGPLSEAITREACWKAAAWARAGMPANVSVNVSALQFRNDRFSDHVLQIVSHAGLAPERLELEITESVAMEDPERTLRLIKPLRDAGVRLAIDDFGCGHSSLSALSKLPFDVIKIDQTFVRGIGKDGGQSAAIIEMILALAGALNLEVVAEGVEQSQQAQFMAERGCHWVQGFLYGAAVSAPEFAEMLRQQRGDEVVSEDAA